MWKRSRVANATPTAKVPINSALMFGTLACWLRLPRWLRRREDRSRYLLRRPLDVQNSRLWVPPRALGGLLVLLHRLSKLELTGHSCMIRLNTKYEHAIVNAPFFSRYRRVGPLAEYNNHGPSPE